MPLSGLECIAFFLSTATFKYKVGCEQVGESYANRVYIQGKGEVEATKQTLVRT